MYSAILLVLFSTSAWSFPIPQDSVVVLRPGENITTGTIIYSPDNNFRFAIEDNRMAVYATCDNSTVFSSSGLKADATRLELTDAGNLELFGTAPGRSGIVWQSGSAMSDDYTNHRLHLSDQGYLELCAKNIKTNDMECYWQSMRFFSKGCRNSDSKESNKILKAGESLKVKDIVYSPSGEFNLTVQEDGNVVLYRACDGAAMFSTYTSPGSAESFSLLSNGNLVVQGYVGAFWPGLWYAEPWFHSDYYNVIDADKYAGSELRFSNNGRLLRCRDGDCYWQSEFFSGSQCVKDLLSSSSKRA